MRNVLIAVMGAQKDTAASLSRRSGVPAGTITRFLKGFHDEPTGATVRKLANAYGLTEGQLRGEVPILHDLSPSPVSKDLAELLSAEEGRVIRSLRSLNKKSREAWITIGIQLAKVDDKQANEPTTPEQGDIFQDALVRSEPHPENTRNEEDERIRSKA
jgi:transcriptional regulator with XRE-family HTH domain